MSLAKDLRRSYRLSTYRARHFWGGGTIWIIYFIWPLVPGRVLGYTFTELQTRGATSRFFSLAFTGLVLELAFVLVHVLAVLPYNRGFNAAVGITQLNVMHAQVVSGGPAAGRRTHAPSSVVSTFRDDARDLVQPMDILLDIIGGAIFATVALFVMARVHALATVAAVVPLFLVTLLNRAVGHRGRRARAKARRSTAELTGFLGAALSAATTIRVLGAGPAVLDRFSTLGDKRARANVTDQVLSESLFTIMDAVCDLCLGLSLLVVALSARSGRMDAGAITVFAAYLGHLIWFPRKIATMFIGHRRFEVASSRMESLLPAATSSTDLIAHRVAPLVGGGPIEVPAPLARRPLSVLTLTGLSNAERGFSGVSLTLCRGQIAVVTGPVGVGKSSLLAAVLGLIPLDAGSISWNGSVIADPAAFFIPPHCAYVPQTPTLFADSLLDNLLLDTAVEPNAMVSALRRSAFESDVEGFGDGLATRIGTRGIRLSGGQLQRAAAARAFLRNTELVILDDLTSALDVETELLLWQRLRAEGITVLAASTRPAALATADVIIDLSA